MKNKIDRQNLKDVVLKEVNSGYGLPKAYYCNNVDCGGFHVPVEPPCEKCKLCGAPLTYGTLMTDY